MNRSIYTTGGTVQAGGGIYLSRKADDELLQLCREGQFAYVLTSRQIGKSSLMVQTAARLEEEDITSVIIDLTKIGTTVTPEQWYLGLLTEIDESLMLDTDIFDWWEEHNHLGVTQRLTRFFEEILLSEVGGRIVLFVDEIDTTLSLEFTDDFFIAIRYFYTARAQKEQLGRLSVVLIGVASPGDLIRDPQRTPFNVGRRVDLTDFTWDEVQGLGLGLSVIPSKAQEILHWVMQWTEGHPYLTQRLCQGVVESGRRSWSAAAIERLVEDLFLRGGVRNDNNLLFVRDMLTQRTPDENKSVYEVLTTYQDVWRERELVLDEEQSLIKSHLKLAGIVRRDESKGSLHVSNGIYRQVFDEGWVKEHLPVNLVKRLRRARVALAAMTAATIASAIFGGWVYVERSNVQAKAREVAQQKITIKSQEDNIKNQEEDLQQQANLNRETSIALDAKKKEAQELTILAQQKQQEASDQTARADASAQDALNQGRIAQEQERIAEIRTQEAQIATQQANVANNTAQENIELANYNETLVTINKTEALALKNLSLDALATAVEAWQRVSKSGFQDRAAVAEAYENLLKNVYPNIKNQDLFQRRYRYYDRFTFREKNSFSFPKVVLNPLTKEFFTLFRHDEKNYIQTLDTSGQTLSNEVTNSLANWSLRYSSLVDIDISPNGQYVVFGLSGNDVFWWERQSNRVKKLIASLEFWNDSLRLGINLAKVAFDRNSQLVAAVWSSPPRIGAIGGNSIIQVVTLEGELITELINTKAVASLAFSPVEDIFAAGYSDGSIGIWSSDGKPILFLDNHSEAVRDLEFSPNGKLLASASDDLSVRIWTRDGELIHTITDHNSPVTSVSFKPGRTTSDKAVELLASGDASGNIKIWEIGHADIVLKCTNLAGHTYEALDLVAALGLNPYCVSQTLDGYNNNSSVLDLQFSSDGNFLVSTHENLTGENSIIVLEQTQNLFGSPDKQVSSWTNNNIELLRIEDNESLRIQTDNSSKTGKDFIASAEYNSDGARCTITIYNPQGFQLATLFSEELNGYSNCDQNTRPVFSPDAHSIGLINARDPDSGGIRWDISPESLVAWSCDWLEDYLLYNPEGIEIAQRGVCADHLPQRNQLHSFSIRENIFSHLLRGING